MAKSTDFKERDEFERKLKDKILLLLIAFHDDVSGHEGFVPADVWTRNERAIESGLQPILKDAYLSSADQLLDEIEKSLNRSKIESEADAWASNHASDLANEIVESTKSAVGDIAAKLQSGEIDNTEFESRLEDIFSSARAESIAITETTTANSFGLLATAAALSLLESGIWHTEQDDLVCEDCAPLDGQSPAGNVRHYTRTVDAGFHLNFLKGALL